MLPCMTTAATALNDARDHCAVEFEGCSSSDAFSLIRPEFNESHNH